MYYFLGSGKSVRATGRLGSDCQKGHVLPTPIIGQMATGWNGWISGVSPGLYASSKDLHTVGVYLNDPFVDILRPSVEYARALNRYDDIQLCCLSSDDAHSLAVGQQVVFCGLISNSTVMSNGGRIVDVDAAVINPGPLPGEPSTEPVPDDFSIRYEAHGCGENYSCPDYSVVINAEGKATYEGYSGVRVSGKNTVAVSEKKLRELVSLLEQVRFLKAQRTFQAQLKGISKAQRLFPSRWIENRKQLHGLGTVRQRLSNFTCWRIRSTK